MSISVSNVLVSKADGSEQSLGEYGGKVLLIVNVASRCGFPRYSGLLTLKPMPGLAILGFPCRFGGQEWNPGRNQLLHATMA